MIKYCKALIINKRFNDFQNNFEENNKFTNFIIKDHTKDSWFSANFGVIDDYILFISYMII